MAGRRGREKRKIDKSIGTKERRYRQEEWGESKKNGENSGKKEEKVEGNETGGKVEGGGTGRDAERKWMLEWRRKRR